MKRRTFVQTVLSILGISVAGCRSQQHAHILSPHDADMVGSTAAGAATHKPLIEEAVGSLLNRHAHGIQTVGGVPGERLRVCFVGVENKSAEELGDFKEQIYEHIDTRIEKSHLYTNISRRYVDAALQETRLRPEDLFKPKEMRTFASLLEQQGQPFDYILFAKLTSGTTRNGEDYQRDYLLTLEMVNIRTGQFDKESALLRKAYHR